MISASYTKNMFCINNIYYILTLLKQKYCLEENQFKTYSGYGEMTQKLGASAASRDCKFNSQPKLRGT